MRQTGSRVRFTFGASGILAQQIENGAPYDVYLSANQGFVKKLAVSGHLLQDTIKVYAYGRIALWSRSGGVRSVRDLLDPKILHVAIANPLHAPYGLAAREALKSQGVWDRIAGKIVYGENVQQTFQYAESGNVDAAITAWSLVYNKGGILLPAAWHSPIRQEGGVVSSSKHIPLARRFLAFLVGPQGRKVLETYGL